MIYLGLMRLPFQKHAYTSNAALLETFSQIVGSSYKSNLEMMDDDIILKRTNLSHLRWCHPIKN